VRSGGGRCGRGCRGDGTGNADRVRGDSLDPLRLAESELILRGTGFLNPVTISAHPAPGGAEVVVETRDPRRVDGMAFWA